MFSFKRALTTGLTALIFSGILPATTFAVLPAGTALITVTSVTPSFDPSINQLAAINYTVTGPAAASNVFINIYKKSVTDGSRICNNLTENYVTTIEGPINRPVGNYTAIWTGRNQNGSVVPPGKYCFDLQWGNLPPGVLTTFLEGRINVSQPQINAGGTGGAGGTGAGGTGAGGTGGAGGAGSQTTGPISASVDPLVINPTATGGNAAYISYIVNQDLPNGFTLKIYDSGNFVVKDLYGTTQRVSAGTRATISWNGRRNNGVVVAPGDYFYKFRVAGADAATGLIRVEYPVSGVPQADIIHYANPSVINPLATPAQIATIYYTVNRRFTTGLTIAIKNGSNTIRTLFGTTAPVNTGNYQVTWNGRYNNGTVVPVGTYRYVFSSGGQEVGFGTIGVIYGDSQPSPPPPAAFIVSHNASPNIFTPALSQSTTITYTLGKSVVNFKFSIRNQLGVEMVTETAASRTAGTYTYVWNGMVGFVPVPAGTYTYVLEAANENPVSGSVTVASLPQGVPVITDLGPDPASFQIAAGQTNFRYQMSQNARCDFTVWNGNPGSAGSTVVRRLQNGIASFATTCSAGATVFAPWDGKNDAGAYVAAGTYYYLIEAVNTNGIAQPKSGSVTVVIVQQQPVLDVSNAFANPNPFNPEVQNTALTFSLNYPANVSITVTRASDNSFVKTLVFNQFYNAGSNQSVLWNGTDWNGQLVSQGVYNFRVDGTSAQYGSDSGSVSVTVNRGTPPQQMLDVSNAFASPNPFNPEVQNTALTFSLNYPANVTINVTRASDNAFVKTVVSNQSYNAGTNLTIAWNGTDWNNQFVAQGTYNFRVDAASAQYGNDSVIASVTVNRGSVLQILGGDSANPNPFNPRAGQVTRVDFSTTVTPSVLTVRIYRNSTNAFVRELPVLTLGTNAYRAEWNGRDGATNSIVSNDFYTYRIEATSAGQTAQKTGSITVIGGPGDPPPPPPPGNCGGFTDVSSGHSLCRALEFVKSRGIFRGYDDGSIGLHRVIQRAEFLAVIQKAFQYPLDPYSTEVDGNLGYSDLTNKTHMWYMPYLKTFKRLGLMVGYPDGKMRPERTMNTAELYVVFLKAAKQAPVDITHFSLANHELTKFAPFRDTPKSHDTVWYLKYAGFAKLNDLVTTERFYPGRGITRGQVIKLIYDTHLKGLITYGPPIL